jgi:hypothetical protein
MTEASCTGLGACAETGGDLAAADARSAGRPLQIAINFKTADQPHT